MTSISSATVVLFGAQDVGKSQLISWYRKGRPRTNYDPTLEQEYLMVERHKNFTADFTYIDTGGDPAYAEFIPEWAQRANACILVFNVDEPASMQRLKNFEAALTQNSNFVTERSPVLLVANSTSGDEGLRRVTRQEVAAFAHALFDGRGCLTIDTCTRDGHNVKKVFATLLKVMGGEDIAALKNELEGVPEQANQVKKDSPKLSVPVVPAPRTLADQFRDTLEAMQKQLEALQKMLAKERQEREDWVARQELERQQLQALLGALPMPGSAQAAAK